MSKFFESLKRAGARLPADPATVLSGEALSSETVRRAPLSPSTNGSGSAHPVVAAEPASPAESFVRTVVVKPAPGVPLFPFGDENAGTAEQYRMIRTRIVQALEAPKLILVSSADSGDGKTTNAVNIAGTLALRSDVKILILDADLCRPAVARLLNISPSPGLADVLRGDCSLDEAIARIEDFPNLYVLPAGDTVSNRTELLDSPKWKEVCDSVRARFQYTLVDAPPIETVADYPLIQATCDAVIVIVRPDHTKRARCLHALKTIPKEKLLGTVINAAEDWFLLRSNHYSYYGYYGSYGAYYSDGKKGSK